MTDVNPAQPTERWLLPWLVAGAVLLWIGVANVIAWLVTTTDLVDEAAAAASGAAVPAMLTYFAVEFRIDSVIFASSAVVAAVILSRYRNHRFGWIMGLGWSVIPMALLTVLIGLVLSVAGPLPEAWAPWLAWFIGATSMAFLPVILYPIAMFPTGRFPSSRWTRVLTIVGAVWLLAAISIAFQPGSPSFFGDGYTFDNPLGWSALPSLDTAVLNVLLPVTGLLVIASVVARYRSGETIERQQLKWFITPVVLLVLAFAIETGGGILSATVGALTVVAIGVAILRYRLYDIDVVINRTVVFIVVAGFITAVYALLVGVIGSGIGGSSLWLAIAATAIVALAFEPVRDRAQRLANRLVYGRRASPYEVLSDLTNRLPEAEYEAGLLDRMAEQLAAGTGADRAQVWLTEPDGLRLVTSYPPNGAGAWVPDLASVPGSVTPIEHDGATLGALTVEKRSGESLTPTEHRLIEDLAGSAGLVVRKVRLDTELEATAQELAASRLRLVEAQDAERRRLERNLHDGAQQHVIGLKVKLALAGRLATDEGSERTATLLTQMSTEAQDAVDEIRALAQGIYPPLLESEGLGPALAALATAAPVPITLDAAVGRFAPEIETAVYFCVSEATTNAIKHATPPIHIAVHGDHDTLTFTVSDLGPGFTPTTATDGSGLTNMTDRIDALGGTLTVTSTPNGSTVGGRVPIRAAART